jgi:PPOX class probable F420-dependent enzyme
MAEQEALRLVDQVGAGDHYLGVLITQDPRGEPQVSVVNGGVLPHPLNGEPRVGVVAHGGTAKLRNLRRRPRATIVFRSGWQWVAGSGPVELAGPDDPMPGLSADGLRQLLRDVYQAAGGSHPDLDEYDRAMAADRRCAVLIRPDRVTTNPTDLA